MTGWSLAGSRRWAIALMLLVPPLLASAASARTSAASHDFESCSWDHRGQDPFMGDLAASLNRYPDLAPDVRQRLQRRINVRDYDDMVDIRRDSITGRHRYDPRITDMHFGERSMCHEVRRVRWTAQDLERGLVFCDSGQCVLVPTVCRNVSRITRLGDAGVPAPAEMAEQPVDELEFEPPAAGPATTTAEGDTSGPSFEELSGTPPPGYTVESVGGPASSGAAPPFEGVYLSGPSLLPAPFPAIGLLPLPPASPLGPSGPTLPAPPIAAIPEPAMALMLPVGLAVIALARRRERKGNGPR